MDEWSSYTLQDFLLFSPATNFRLLEMHNAALWPLHILTIGVGISLAVLLRSGWPHRDRAVGGILAACWLWVAWSFFLGRYASINWAAPWFAALFAVQAVLSLLAGFAGGGQGFGTARSRAESALFLVLLFVQPAAGLLGRPWRQAEVFAIAPDPTAMATLGALILAPRQSAWLLSPIPVLWCAIGGATLWAMGTSDAWVPPMTAVIAVILMVVKPTRHHLRNAPRRKNAG